MNITRNNFRDHFDELKEVINAANVLAIDCKCRRLSNDNSNIQQYDSPSEYLQKLSQQTSGYFATEFGLTAFRAKGDDTQNFTYRSYIFSVFPQMRKQRFDCQGDSMAFLGAMNIDSNSEGIPYCDEEEAKRLREQLHEKIKSIESIQQYAEKLSASSHSEHHQKDQLLELRQDIDTERKQMEDIIGFHNFINFLSQTNKLIVGHNLLLDMIYTMKQFVSPIPPKLQDFKAKTHKTFPNLLDTKYMCTDDTIKPYINSSDLARLFDTTSEEPFVRPTFEAEAVQYSYSLLHKPKEHEAGYDSFMTGVCFVTMANYLQVYSCDINEKSTRLRPILNKLFLDIAVNHINLTGKKPKLNKMSAPSNDKQTICDICKAPRPKKNLAKHKRICRGPDYINRKNRKHQHFCTMCKYSSSQRTLLVQHMAHKHKKDTALIQLQSEVIALQSENVSLKNDKHTALIQLQSEVIALQSDKASLQSDVECKDKLLETALDEKRMLETEVIHLKHVESCVLPHNPLPCIVIDTNVLYHSRSFFDELCADSSSQSHAIRIPHVVTLEMDMHKHNKGFRRSSMTTTYQLSKVATKSFQHLQQQRLNCSGMLQVEKDKEYTKHPDKTTDMAGRILQYCGILQEKKENFSRVVLCTNDTIFLTRASNNGVSTFNPSQGYNKFLTTFNIKPLIDFEL